MKYKLNLYNLFIGFFLSSIFFLIISFFFSAQKILIVFLTSIVFFFAKIKHQKVILINLVVLVVLLKVAINPFQKKIDAINPSITTIYEKHFLYGLKNLNFSFNSYNGDLSSLDKKLKIKYSKSKNPKKIKIITDNFGFRNKTEPKNAKYILVGDSLIYSYNINQEAILNYVLNSKHNLKTYNAGLPVTDLSHYFETIKFFNKKMKLHNKKYIMFVSGTDFINYKLNDNSNYHKYINANVLHTYFRFKVFFNFYNSLKHFYFSIRRDGREKPKVFEYDINGQDVLFQYDANFEHAIEGASASSLPNIFNEYNKYLPDVMILIPTKNEVYCNFIENKTCKNVDYFSVLKNDSMLSNVKILDTTVFFKNKAKSIMKTKNELLYEIDDTHLNEMGISVLAEFVSNHI